MRTRSAVTVFLVAGASVMAVCLLLWGNVLSSASELEVDPAPEKTTPAMGSVSDPIPVSFTSRTTGAGEVHTMGHTGGCELFATIVPTHMTLTSEVATRDNCTHATVCSWFDDTPTGTIILGVDPTSPDPSDWDGGSATAEIYIGDIVSPTVGILTVSWLERDGRGIHSPLKGQVATIRLDGDLLWSKRTLQQSTFGDYYAAERGPIELTFVVTRSITHTLAFSVPAQTAWDISQVTIHLCPMPSAIRGLAYSPFRDCQTPHWGDLYPSTEEIREDMPLLFHSANAIRTYSSLNSVGQIPAMAHEWGLRVSVGAWLGREIGEGGEPISNTNTEEISGAIAIANTVPVESVIVGNEVLLRKDLTITQLITYINHVKANIPPTVEVTTAETWSLWMGRDEHYPEAQVKELVDAVDYILVHIHPYWDKVSVDLAATQVISQYKALQREYPEKRVVIGETGWPTAGETNKAAVPSVENQLRFLTEFLSLAEQEGVEFYYFDPFDELWKRWPSRKDGGEGESGAHWGLGYADRTAKHVLQGVLVPHSPLFSPRVYLPLIFRNSEGGPAGTFAWSPPLSSWTGDRTIASSTTVTFPVYTEWIALDNHFIPSGWMGDWGSIDFYECERAHPYSGEMAIRVRYATTGTQGWAGIYWQEPENNWGTIEGAGYDLDDASYLRFHARGDEGGEQVKFLMGGIWDDHPDSQQPALSTDVLTLSQDWLTYTIDLRGRDLSRVIGGFGFVTDRCLNTEPITFYLDDIYYVLGGDPGTPAPTPTPQCPYSFDVYRDGDIAGNHYVPTGWMGDTGDIVLDECYRDDTHAGSTAIRVTYTAMGDGPYYGCRYLPPCNWAGVYWQDPADNWGDRPGGYDLTGAHFLTFWARGAKGGEKISFKVGGIGCGSTPYPDSLCPVQVLQPAPTILTANWQRYAIPLSVDLNLSDVVGGFLWAASKNDNPNGATFYLDDIRYLFSIDGSLGCRVRLPIVIRSYPSPGS